MSTHQKLPPRFYTPGHRSYVVWAFLLSAWLPVQGQGSWSIEYDDSSRAGNSGARSGQSSSRTSQGGSGIGESSAGAGSSPGGSSNSAGAANDSIRREATTSPATNDSSAATGTSAAAGSSQPAQAKKPVKLYGRIEELCQVKGAKLPIKLQALTPKMDTRATLNAHTSIQSGRVSEQATYPTDWAGTWSGSLKVWTAQFDPSRWHFDADEASQEQELLKPGTTGQVSFTFAMDSYRRIALEPTQVVFTAPMNEKRSAQLMQQMQSMMPGLQEMLGAGAGGAMMSQVMQSVPYMYALHLGDLTHGTGVTGNTLDSRTLKNEVSVLKPGTLEEQIVTYNEDLSRASGKKKYGYAETVVRFTRLNHDQLYVQAASVDYDRSGQFEDKVVLFGTMNRGSAGAPAMPNTMPGGLPNIFQGGGALQNLLQFGQ